MGNCCHAERTPEVVLGHKPRGSQRTSAGYQKGQDPIID